MPSVEVLRESLGKIAVLVHPVKKNGLAYVVIGHAYDADDPTVQRLVEYVTDPRPDKGAFMSAEEATEIAKTLDLQLDEAMAVFFPKETPRKEWR
jgi:hypothetical protein